MMAMRGCAGGLCLALLAACSSHSGSTPANGSQDAGATADAAVPPAVDAAVLRFSQPATEHGVFVDYFTQKGVAGLTVTDNGMTSTTDADGNWSITVPAGAILAPTVAGPSFSTLFFPEAVPNATDVDYGTSVMASSNNYQLELSTLAADGSMALVNIIAKTAPTCASAAGGQLGIVSPADAKITYFNTSGFPDESVTSFQDVLPTRPVAVVYDVPPGAELRVQATHPSCKQRPFPYDYLGKTYTGNVIAKAAEPGDVNSAFVIELE